MFNIQEIIKKELEKLGLDLGSGVPTSAETSSSLLEHPKTLEHGDYSFFIKDKAIDVSKLPIDKIKHKYIEKVVVVGKFINFYLSKQFFTDSLEEILEKSDQFGRNKNLDGEKIIIEYTDPNPFKEFHIGHLMSNAIGESLSRLLEWGGANVKRACYQGDVGLHVAKAIWAMKKLTLEMPDISANLSQKVEFLGKAYVYGARSYEEDQNFKKEIDELNKIIYEKSSLEINKLYEWGREASLKHLDSIYKKLGTTFDYFFYESEAGKVGMFLVEELLKKGILAKSDGAVIFKGEEYGLHTRVFVTSQGLPTYETKELGLAKMKSDREDFDRSIVVTASEQGDYFRVALKVLGFVDSTAENKTRHVSHGMLRFAEGKMSSRKGNIITGESLVTDVEELVLEKVRDRELGAEEKEEIKEAVAVGAIKYSILKQSPGHDIIFDFNRSLSFEGDSGPYLQYTYARANSVLEKAKKENIEVIGESGAVSKTAPEAAAKTTEIEKLLYRFPEIVSRALNEQAPQYITTYLTQIASAFNNFYANNQIVNVKDEESPHKILLTEAFRIVMKNGLYLLGIRALDKM